MKRIAICTSVLAALFAVPAYASGPVTGTLSPAFTVPPTIVSAGYKNDALTVAGYLDVTLYGADKTGKTDTTTAVQNALNDALKYGMVAYFPSGTYLVSNTLSDIQLGGTNTHPINGPNGIEVPVMAGPPTGARPTIVLKDGSSGFSSTTSPKPLVHFETLCQDNTSASACPGQLDKQYGPAGAFDILYQAAIRDINFKTGNNPGAIGVQFYSAQFSYMQNVSVDATGGYAGIDGGPTTSDWVNIDVNGGQYGMKLGMAAGSNAVVGLTLENQTVAGLWAHFAGGNAITGFNIQETASGATGILLPTQAIQQFTTISLLDGIISVAGTQPAITNTGGDSVYMNNVYVHAPSVLIANPTGSMASSGKTDLITEYSHADQSTASTLDGYAFDAYNYLNDVKSKSDYISYSANAGTPPSDLIIRHLPGQLPSPMDNNAVWVTAYGADPKGVNDSTAAIRNAIAASESNGSNEVFLPRGNYQISGTLQLNPDTKFFGIPGMFSNLSGMAFDAKSVYAPFIATANTATGKTFVGDLLINMPADSGAWQRNTCPKINCTLFNGKTVPSITDDTYLTSFLWQAGRSSVMNQVGIQFQWLESDMLLPSEQGFAIAARKLIEVSGNGGGRWYGLNEQYNESTDVTGNPNFRGLLVQGTTEPLTLYGSNPEHMGSDLYEFSNAKNIRVLGMKTECCRGNLVNINSGSSNIIVSGVSGDTEEEIAISNSTNISVNTLNYYGETGSWTQTAHSVTDGTTTVKQIDAIGLFKLGSLTPSAFPHCGDGICDGGETSGNCSSDCTGGSSAPQACSFNGSSIPSGSSITAYLASSVATGQTCTSETRACSNGTLSGTYTYPSCSVAASSSCSFNGQTVANGASVTAYLASSVPAGQTCTSQARACSNGTLSGTYTFASCSVASSTASSASYTISPNPVQVGQTVTVKVNITPGFTNNGSSVILWFYKSDGTYIGAATVANQNFTAGKALAITEAFPLPSTATAGTYYFNTGVYTGAYGTPGLFSQTNAATFTVGTTPPAACSFNNQSVASGSSVTAFQDASVAYGQTCTSESRTCTNGTLSGSYTNASCTVAAPVSCSFNGATVASGSSVTAYQAASVAAGQTCASQTRACTNGTLSGTYTFANCSVAAPVTSSSFTITPAPATVGQAVTVMAAINPGVTASNAKLTIWVYNAATGAYVTSASTTGISYTAGKVTTTAVVLPATLAEGVYTFNPSAYSSTGAGLWGITNAATFVVAAAPTFTVTPNPATAGQTITVKANIDAGVTASNAKLTIWLYNASTGAYVNSASVTGLAYTAGKITSVSVTLPTLPAGSYTFNPSLYSSTGAGLWGITKAATFTVK